MDMLLFYTTGICQRQQVRGMCTFEKLVHDPPPLGSVATVCYNTTHK